MRRDSALIEAADAAALHLAPPVTESKIARLRLLARHEKAGIRQSVASNRHAPADLLATLATDPDAAVRGEVARNDSAPRELVGRLAADHDARVRCWAVLNPGLDEGAVEALLKDPDRQVRRLAGWRHEQAQASVEVLEQA